MINSNELIFVVDENNNPLEPKPRSLAHKNGLWHRTSGIWILNPKKQILCQKRSLKKDVNPGKWEAFFGGHLGPNENYKDNAIHEVEEELGIKMNNNELIPYKVFKSDKPTHKEFQQVFTFVLNSDDNSFQFEKDEIDELKWINFSEVKNILSDLNDKTWVHKPWDHEVLTWLSTF